MRKSDRRHCPVGRLCRQLSSGTPSRLPKTQLHGANLNTYPYRVMRASYSAPVVWCIQILEDVENILSDVGKKGS